MKPRLKIERERTRTNRRVCFLYDSVEVRMTKTGKMKETSFDHLTYLKLESLAELSGANTLGGNIRKTLLREYPI